MTWDARTPRVTALAAVAGQPAPQHVSALVLFDNEEIGSVSATGARGAWLGRQLERSVLARGGTRDDFLRAVAGSVHVSADMSHATHPNYPDRHEPEHQIALNGGPIVKMSANVLYATEAKTHAAFLLAAEQAGVPVQYFVNRSGVRSGSTIGPVRGRGAGDAHRRRGQPGAGHALRARAVRGRGLRDADRGAAGVPRPRVAVPAPYDDP